MEVFLPTGNTAYLGKDKEKLHGKKYIPPHDLATEQEHIHTYPNTDGLLYSGSEIAEWLSCQIALKFMYPLCK